MHRLRDCAVWGLAAAGLLLSPVALILAVPAAVGLGLDIFDMTGEAPLVLALCAPAAGLLLWHLPHLPHLPRADVAAHHGGDLHYAP